MSKKNRKAGNGEVLLSVDGPTCFYCLGIANDRRLLSRERGCWFMMGGYEGRTVVFVSGRREGSRVGVGWRSFASRRDVCVGCLGASKEWW
jgi:hypothetical protein